MEKQYQDSSNLSRRASLHKKFGTNPVSWQKWLWKKLDLSLDAAILDLGVGPGYFWQENEKTVPEGWNIFLTDISGGMLRESRALLSENRNYSYLVVDAVDIPFPEGKFDGVVANHMLHHVRDVNQTLSEIRRCLKENGLFCAATNRPSHLKELLDLENEYFGQKGTGQKYWLENFNLENGSDLLSPYFSTVSSYEYKNLLKVTDPAAVSAYLESKSDNELDPTKIASLTDFLSKEISRTGFFEITANAGVFICQ